MRLVLAAAVALAASPVGAEIIGMQRCILGGDEGFFRCDAPTGEGEDTLTIGEMPYERTVTCDDITLTGTATGGGAVTWSASPSGASGSCTGTTSWSCVVDVDPDASGEGVETITVSQSGGGSDTVDVGFYVDGAHSCFLSQNIDGSYNSSFANLDPVATWTNLGSSALDVTQGTAANQPTFRTSIVAGQPVVRCDGGDRVAAATAAAWTFLNSGVDFTTDLVANHSNNNVLFTFIGTTNSIGSTTRGFAVNGDDRASVPAIDRARMGISSGTVVNVALSSADSAIPSSSFFLLTDVLDDDGGVGDDAFQFCNGSACGTAAASGTYSGSSPIGALNICALPGGGSPLTGDLFRVLIYQSALDATQRGINKAVDEWALGGTLPVTP